MPKLSEICLIQAGQNAPQDACYYNDNGLSFIKASDLDTIINDDKEDNCTKITNQAVNDCKLKLFNANSIIFAKSGLSCLKNRIYKCKKDFYLVNHLCALTLTSENYYIDWLLYFLKKFNLTNLIKDMAYPSISLTAIKNIEIPTIDIKTQQIQSFNLQIIEKLIKYKQLEIKHLDDLVKSRFNEMFDNVETNRYSYNKLTINDICSSIVRGPFGSVLKKEFFVEKGPNTFKVYEQKHAIQKNASLGEYYIDENKFKQLKRFECKPGDFIMSCSGTIGELYRLPEICEKGIINQALCKFTLNNMINPIVFDYSFKSIVSNLETKGSGIKNIGSVNYIKSIELLVPPKNIQDKFADFVKLIDKSKFNVQKEIDSLKELFDAKLDEYFN